MTFKKIFSRRVAQVSFGIILACATAMPVLAHDAKGTAQESPRATPSATRIAKQMTRMIERANRAIDQRITRLNALADRIKEMKKITDTDKTDLANTVHGEVITLTNLKAKIAADTDNETVRTDMQSITKAYRIYALVMPRIAILAAADRATVISDALTVLSQKLADRMSAAQTAGNNITSSQSVLSDMNTKIADAKTQVDSARQQIASLVPDNGDQAMFDANKLALKAAHEKIKTAKKDLETARKDAQTIAKTLKSFAKPSPSGSSSPSASTSPSPTPTNS